MWVSCKQSDMTNTVSNYGGWFQEFLTYFSVISKKFLTSHFLIIFLLISQIFLTCIPDYFSIISHFLQFSVAFPDIPQLRFPFVS